MDFDKFKWCKNPEDGVKKSDIVVYRNEAGVIIHTGIVSSFETYSETRENEKVVTFTVPLVRSKMSIPGAVYDLGIDLTGSAFGKSSYGRPYQKSTGGFEIYSGGDPLQPEISAPPP